jgi:small nuclear ribonucleoprotein E
MQGFDEFMNLVITNAVEVHLKTKNQEESRRPLGKSLEYSISVDWMLTATGRILLKGENVALIQDLGA